MALLRVFPGTEVMAWTSHTPYELRVAGFRAQRFAVPQSKRAIILLRMMALDLESHCGGYITRSLPA